MITSEDMDRNVFPELEGKKVNDEIEINWISIFSVLFAAIHGVLYLIFFSLITSRTVVFRVIEGDLIFNISKFGRLLYKVFDINEYFL